MGANACSPRSHKETKPCLLCGKELVVELWDRYSAPFVWGGFLCECSGNFGSKIYDPAFSGEHEVLRFALCDECVIAKGDCITRLAFNLPQDPQTMTVETFAEYRRREQLACLSSRFRSQVETFAREQLASTNEQELREMRRGRKKKNKLPRLLGKKGIDVLLEKTAAEQRMRIFGTKDDPLLVTGNGWVVNGGWTLKTKTAKDGTLMGKCKENPSGWHPLKLICEVPANMEGKPYGEIFRVLLEKTAAELRRDKNES